MIRQFLVSVETNEELEDTLDDQTIMDEIEANLTYEATGFGIVKVSVLGVQWECGCGTFNGINSIYCCQCNRRPGDRI